MNVQMGSGQCLHLEGWLSSDQNWYFFAPDCILSQLWETADARQVQVLVNVETSIVPEVDAGERENSKGGIRPRVVHGSIKLRQMPTTHPNMKLLRLPHMERIWRRICDRQAVEVERVLIDAIIGKARNSNVNTFWPINWDLRTYSGVKLTLEGQWPRQHRLDRSDIATTIFLYGPSISEKMSALEQKRSRSRSPLTWMSCAQHYLLTYSKECLRLLVGLPLPKQRRKGWAQGQFSSRSRALRWEYNCFRQKLLEDANK